MAQDHIAPLPPLRPLDRAGLTVLQTMQQRPSEWWFLQKEGLREILVQGSPIGFSTIIAGLDQLEDHGLVTHRWAPRDGETEAEA